MSGSGNDFILIDNRQEIIRDHELAPLVSGICCRRQSVGADGVIFVVNSDQYDFDWRFFNADGSEVAMCGNGGRCVSRFAFTKGITGPKMTFGTPAGPVRAEVNGRIVKIQMPEPSGLSPDLSLEPKKGWTRAGFINTGVPHVVMTVADLENHPVCTQGREIRYHSLFAPEGANADFMIKTGPNRLKVRTYERGVEDETLACGTGAIACSLLAARWGMVEGSPVIVETRSKEELTIHFQMNEDSFEQVALEGNTTMVYEATLNKEALLI